MKKMDNKNPALINPNQIKFNTLDPKLMNRFMVKFSKPYDVIVPYVIKAVTRPQFVFYNGETEYKDIHMELYDTINPSTTYELINVIRTQEGNRKEIKFVLDVLGPIGDVVESWEIAGDIKTIDFGEMNWDSYPDAPMTIELIIQVNDATLIF